MPEVTRAVVELVVDYSGKNDLPRVETQNWLCSSTNDDEIVVRKAKDVVAVGRECALGNGVRPAQRALPGDARERTREHGICRVGDTEGRVVHQPGNAKGQRRIALAEELALGMRGNIQCRRGDGQIVSGKAAQGVIAVGSQSALVDGVRPARNALAAGARERS